MKVLELCGLSGSGKTTVYQEMLKIGGFFEKPLLSAKQAVDAREVLLKATDEEILHFANLIERMFYGIKPDYPDAAQRWSFIYRTLYSYAFARCDPRGGYTVLDGGLVRRADGIDD